MVGQVHDRVLWQGQECTREMRHSACQYLLELELRALFFVVSFDGRGHDVSQLLIELALLDALIWFQFPIVVDFNGVVVEIHEEFESRDVFSTRSPSCDGFNGCRWSRMARSGASRVNASRALLILSL